MKNTLLLLLIATTFCFARCVKEPVGNNGLPPATQTGANTLGFLLNGQPWTPKGFNGSANLSLYYDPSFRGGVFNISAYKIQNNNSNAMENIIIASDSIQTIGEINFGKKNFTVIYQDFSNSSCRMDTRDSAVIVTGSCTITKLNKLNQIFSGKFEFTFKKAGCPDVQITQGRFDLKY